MADNRANSLSDFLKLLGLNDREVKVFTTLADKGMLTTVELSRATSIPRTTLYRIIENLKKLGLVKEIVDEYVLKAQAAPVSQLEYLVKERMSDSWILQSMLPTIKKEMDQKQSAFQPQTKVLMYRGKEGIRQMIWNVLQTKKEVLGYSYRLLDDFVGESFMNRWREEFTRRKLKGRDLYSDAYLQSVRGNRNGEIDFAMWNSRYISARMLDIDHQIDVYDDVVGIYNWHEGEVFGVEIYNKKVARMQKQIFEIVWQMAKSSE